MNIFGSPAEPMFNSNSFSSRIELIDEWIQILFKESELLKKKKQIDQGLFRSGSSAEFIFNICSELNLSPRARYISIELFTRFMNQHLVDLYDYIASTKSSTSTKDWQNVVERLTNQVKLRAVTCCQISSKLISHQRIISPREVKRLLEKFGHSYSCQSILNSELRVLKTLNYKVMFTTPLVYIETTLELLGSTNSELEVKKYHTITLKLLDLYYIKRVSISQRINEDVAKSQSNSEELDVENDFMLVAFAVILVSSYILDQSHTDQVMEYLSNTIKFSKDLLLRFATAFIAEIFEE